MAAPVFIGDEISAAGYRLAGIRIRTPEAGDLAKILNWAYQNASLILLTQEYANQLANDERDKLLSQIFPAVVVVPDVMERVNMEDLAVKLKTQLGMME